MSFSTPSASTLSVRRAIKLSSSLSAILLSDRLVAIVTQEVLIMPTYGAPPLFYIERTEGVEEKMVKVVVDEKVQFLLTQRVDACYGLWQVRIRDQPPLD